MVKNLPKTDASGRQESQRLSLSKPLWKVGVTLNINKRKI